MAEKNMKRASIILLVAAVALVAGYTWASAQWDATGTPMLLPTQGIKYTYVLAVSDGQDFAITVAEDGTIVCHRLTAERRKRVAQMHMLGIYRALCETTKRVWK